MKWLAMFCAAAIAPLLAHPAQAAALDGDNPFHSATPYETCLAAIEKKPDDAFETAMTWRDHGGGLPAEHCAAMALIALDEPGEAASRLEALARRPDAGSTLERAALLGQSGNGWLLAMQPQNAEAVFTEALKLTPGDADLLVDRARSHAALQDWKGADADLGRALALDHMHPETYVLRASARQALGNAAGYRADIAQALKLDPTFPEALVERGSMKLAAGDKKGARADWMQVLLRAPDSPAGDAVRARIENMEVHDR